MLTDEQIIDKYGRPGNPDNLVIIQLPYKMRIAWDLNTSVNRIQCHKLVAGRLGAIFNTMLVQYTYDRIKELGIDLFGGCVNVRLMRGSKTKWSRHAWGIAVDLSPALNGLKTKWKDAQFSKPEYKMMLDIFYANGFFSLGKERNYDAMHFEVSS